MILRKGTRKTGDKGFVIHKCPKCGHEEKMNAEKVMGTIIVLEDMLVVVR